MTFSHRTNWNLEENELTAAVRARRAAGDDLIDLTVSNPTACGFDHDTEALLAPLRNPAAIDYDPASLGMPSAREAVAAYYGDHGADIAIDRLCLTTSTSEAYSFLFRLLCDPDDEVLVARPSYPLFEYIARLDDVQLREYPLFYDPNAYDPNTHSSGGAHWATADGWGIDLHALEAAIGPRTRAIVVVHPNNPTGNFVSAAEAIALRALCREHGLALIVDEVFLDYAVSRHAPIAAGAASADTQPLSFAGERECLTFVLSGLSKICALPQMKVSWIAVCGPDALTQPAMARLEIIADTFLSVNTPMQLALPHWLSQRHRIQRQIGERMRGNLALLDQRLRGTAGTGQTLAHRLALQGGWTTVLRVPRSVNGASFVEAALASGVLVQPGEFYGMGAGRVVLSLLSRPELWAEGLRRLPIDGESSAGVHVPGW
jgi:aspartate/methionine/tyrosine aminotransferase